MAAFFDDHRRKNRFDGLPLLLPPMMMMMRLFTILAMSTLVLSYPFTTDQQKGHVKESGDRGRSITANYRSVFQQLDTRTDEVKIVRLENKHQVEGRMSVTNTHVLKESRKLESERRIIIPVLFYFFTGPEVITHSLSSNEGKILMDGLNHGFRDTPFFFQQYITSISTSVGNNSTSCDSALNFARSNRIWGAGLDVLKVYMCDVVSYMGKPGDTRDVPFYNDPSNDTLATDGILLMNTKLPSAITLTLNDIVEVFIHEAGHWLGLQHTFEGGCSDSGGGDGIADTNPHEKPTNDEYHKNEACGANKTVDWEECCWYSQELKTCGDSAAPDPTLNYMNYIRTECSKRYGEFTPNQIEYMIKMYNKWRNPYVLGDENGIKNPSKTVGLLESVTFHMWAKKPLSTLKGRVVNQMGPMGHDESNTLFALDRNVKNNSLSITFTGQNLAGHYEGWLMSTEDDPIFSSVFIMNVEVVPAIVPASSGKKYIIPVLFINLVLEDDAQTGLMSETEVRLYTSTLNEAFKNTPFQFLFDGVAPIHNNAAARCENLKDLTDIMKGTCNAGYGRDSLLVYLCDTLGSPANVQGWTYPPNITESEAKYMDGIYLMNPALKSSRLPVDDLRSQQELIHQMGHWLGLNDTFMGGCNKGVSDGIADTPSHRGATNLEPMTTDCWVDQNLDTCDDSLPGINKGPDPVSNYMNHIPAECMQKYGHFTAGQIVGMESEYKKWRHSMFDVEGELFKRVLIGEDAFFRVKKPLEQGYGNTYNYNIFWEVDYLGYSPDAFTPHLLRVPGMSGNDTGLLAGVSFSGQNVDGNYTYMLYIFDEEDCYNGNMLVFMVEVVDPSKLTIGAKHDEFTVQADSILAVSAPGVTGNDNFGRSITEFQVSQKGKKLPSHGSLKLYNTGGFEYTPHSKCFSGEDNFHYEICSVHWPDVCSHTSVSIAITQPVDATPVINGKLKQNAVVLRKKKKGFKIHVIKSELYGANMRFIRNDDDAFMLKINPNSQDYYAKLIFKGRKVQKTYIAKVEISNCWKSVIFTATIRVIGRT